MPVNARQCPIPHYTAGPLQFADYGENQQAVLGVVYRIPLNHANNITKVKGPWSHDIPLASCLQALGIVPGAPDGRYVRYTPPTHAHLGWRTQCGQFMHDTHN
ncbi:hypothetical protein EDC01DRAFT_636659 [Geopyxis carbonaria]|nr:hypothetical protein EDC01DRAFT_636659 [Geopyxis carbonaria]